MTRFRHAAAAALAALIWTISTAASAQTPPPASPPPLPPPGYAAPPADAAAQPYALPPMMPYYRFKHVDIEDIDYEGGPVPYGCHVVTKTRRGLVISGAVLFGSTYLLSIIGGAMDVDNRRGDGLSPMFVPFAGPFITLGNTHADGLAAVALVADGVTQIGGAAMFIAGLAATHQVLRPDIEEARRSIRIAPLVGSTTGVAAYGRF